MPKKELKSEEFFRLYSTAQKRLYAFLLIMVHNTEDAEDLLQETASVLWEKFDEFDRTKSFSAWGIGIARNKALGFLKIKRISRPMFNADFYDEISEIASAQIRNQRDRSKALRDCIKKLSSRNQELIYLRFEKAFSVKKISQISEITTDAIYKRISRIYSALNDCVHRTLL